MVLLQVIQHFLVMHHSERLGCVRRAINITIFRMMERHLWRAGASPDDDKVSLGCPRPDADTGDMVSIRFLTGKGHFTALSLAVLSWEFAARWWSSVRFCRLSPMG